MAIESMGAATANVVQPSQQPQQAEQAKRPPVEPPQKSERVQQQAQETQAVSAEKLEAAIDRSKSDDGKQPTFFKLFC